MAEAPAASLSMLGATSDALSAPDIAFLKAELGATVDLADLQTRHARLGDVRAVAAEVVRERFAALLAGPSSFSIPGVYSESTNEGTLKALQAQADRLQSSIDVAVASAVGGGRLVRPDRVR